MNIKKHYDGLQAFVKWRLIDNCFSWLQRSKLKNKDFTIICNNCIGGGIYHKFGIKYTSPTVGLFFYLEDYIKLLENFEYYINQPLKFKNSSIHDKVNELRKTKNFPIGVLGDDVEIFFMHYKDEAEAQAKWTRRVKRINYDNLFFIYSDAGDFCDDFLSRYEKLPFDRKIFFSATPSNSNCVVFVRDYENAMGYGVGDSARNRKYEKYFNVTKWLNGDKDFFKHKVDTNEF